MPRDKCSFHNSPFSIYTSEFDVLKDQNLKLELSHWGGTDIEEPDPGAYAKNKPVVMAKQQIGMK